MTGLGRLLTGYESEEVNELLGQGVGVFARIAAIHSGAVVRADAAGVPVSGEARRGVELLQQAATAAGQALAGVPVAEGDAVQVIGQILGSFMQSREC